MAKTTFKSIRTKLISNTMLMISLIFILVLSAITVMNVRAVHKNVEKAEQNIRSSLIAKGKTLANNNAMAMRGMAEDNAFIAIQTLVSSTVRDDDDIEYGIFTDDSRIAWVNASSKNPSGKVQSPDPLTDPLSQWAHNLRSLSYKEISYGNQQYIEFAAPVIFEEDVLGVIRYGFNTRSMNKALREAFENGRQTRNQTILVLLFLGGFSLGISYLVVRHLASAITKPIGALVRSTKDISEGNYQPRIKPESNDEIGNLAADFEAMRQTIKKYTDHLQELLDEKLLRQTDRCP